jgi:hypothetical protein
MKAFATPARTATLLAALVLLAAVAVAAAAPAGAKPAAPAGAKPAAPAGAKPAAPAGAKPIERRLHPAKVEASSFLSNDKKPAENHHPDHVADDDPATAWIEGDTSHPGGKRLWLNLTSYNKATRVRLRVRNGYQKSKDLWKAYARAKEVQVRLMPGMVMKAATLADTDGWQEVVVDQPRGMTFQIELVIDSVYDGAKHAELAISDIQVFVTSEEREDPAHEKANFVNLAKRKDARVAVAKEYAAKQAELPIYPAYEVQAVKQPTSDWPLNDLLEEAMKDPGFAKEWKVPLAAAMALDKDLGSTARAQLTPMSQTRLVEVQGLQIAGIFNPFSSDGAPPRSDAIRLPMIGLVSAMFADQLRAADVQTGQTIAQYKQDPKGCGSADLAWVARTKPKEGPSRVAAIAIGRCQRMDGRGGPFLGITIELMIYDPSGKLVLLSGDGYLEAYRWTMEGQKPMLAGGRSMRHDGQILEARRAKSASAP